MKCLNLIECQCGVSNAIISSPDHHQLPSRTNSIFLTKCKSSLIQLPYMHLLASNCMRIRRELHRFQSNITTTKLSYIKTSNLTTTEFHLRSVSK